VAEIASSRCALLAMTTLAVTGQYPPSLRAKILDVFVDHWVYALLLIHFTGFHVNPYLVALNVFLVPFAYVLGTTFKQARSSNWLKSAFPRLSFLKNGTDVGLSGLGNA
jgi:hypothetical protein